MENSQKKNKKKKMLQPRQLKTSKKVVPKEVKEVKLPEVVKKVKLPAVVAERKQERKPQMLISEINSSIFQSKICEKNDFYLRI